jgi:hypothetical protein
MDLLRLAISMEQWLMPPSSCTETQVVDFTQFTKDWLAAFSCLVSHFSQLIS